MSKRKGTIKRKPTVKQRREAEELASRYRLIVERSARGRYVGTAIEMPTVVISADTEEACVRRTREALATAVHVMRELNKQPPLPSSEEKRTEQLNVRLTQLEKLRLEEAAKRQGFRGVSDFVRTKALADA